jgi:hypothetical protein
MASGWAIVAAYRLKRTRKIAQKEDSKNNKIEFNLSDISII